MREAIGDDYVALCERRGAELTVAVRSSATIEDSTEASCAGQFRTFLGASGVEEVLEQVEQCWIAAFEPADRLPTGPRARSRRRTTAWR